jgi:hypothetical protein
MRRFPVTESHKVSATLSSVTAERNRLISWDSLVQGLTKPSAEIPSSKNLITLGPFRFLSNVITLFLASLANLPYALFKLGYEIAKLVTRGISRIRSLLFVAK